MQSGFEGLNGLTGSRLSLSQRPAPALRRRAKQADRQPPSKPSKTALLAPHPEDHRSSRTLRQPHAAHAAPTSREAVKEAAQSLETASLENGSSSALDGAESPLLRIESEAHRDVFAPEDLVLAPGEAGRIDRHSAASPADVFRCPGCVEPACQEASGCREMQWRHSTAGYLRKILDSKVYDVAVESRLEKADTLSEKHGNSLLLKREDLQPVFSFKLRGAYNKLVSLTPEQRAKGVICSSAGNHAQGVALGSQKLGCRAVICMPTNTPEIKVAAVVKLGGQVELVGESYTETQAYAQEKAAREGLVFVHPYDDPYVIAGQGTIGAEIVRQLTAAQRDSLEAVFIAIGGGGLAAGIAVYIREILPEVKLFGVEPTGANCMTLSLERGRRVSLSKVDAFADGVAVKSVGAETFRLCRDLLDGVILVDNRAISGAIKSVFDDTRSILEPAGAVAVAGAAQYLERHNIKGRTVIAVTSGANMNFDRLRIVGELAGVGVRKEATFVTTIPEKPGSFLDFVEVVLENSNLQLTEFKYRFSKQEYAKVLWGAEVQSERTTQELVDRLNARGMQTQDKTGDEELQVFLSRLSPGAGYNVIPSEKIIKVVFPERAGALRKFLREFVPFNITLFDYRLSGNLSTTLLLGIQVPAEAEAAFRASQETLRDEFSFSEVSADGMKFLAL